MDYFTIERRHGQRMVDKSYENKKQKEEPKKPVEHCLRRGQTASEGSDSATYELAAADCQAKFICVAAFMCVPLVCNT